MIKNVLEWLENRDENKIAYSDEKSQLTFNQVLTYSKKIGSALKIVTDDKPIAIIGSRSIYTICAYFGIVYSGHAYAPIDGDLPHDRIKAMIDTLKPSVVIADAKNYDKAKNFHDNVFLLEDLIKNEIDELFLTDKREKMVITDPLYILFTSGSTGKPKGVVTSHQSLIYYIQAYTKVMGIVNDDIIGNQSPLDYVSAIRDIYIPILVGCSVVIIPRNYCMQPSVLFDYLNKMKITTIGWSTSLLSTCVALGVFKSKKIESIRKISFSGSVMPPKVLKEWQDNIPEAKFVNQYGPTEATASCTYYEVDHKVDINENILIGKPYDNYRVFLVNKDLSLTKKGEIGEICISGPILALGYYNDIERTNISFINNPNCKEYKERMYRTGDYGRINEEGMLEFHGRIDRQIKHMGHRVELDEIESVANNVEGLEECAIIYNGEKEIIYLFYSGNCENRDISLYLRNYLPDFMIPRKIIKVENLPRLQNGKVDINHLKEKTNER